MRYVFLVLALFCFCLPLQAEFVGAELPLTDGFDDDGSGVPDGWSGIPVMYGHQLPAGESVNVVRYYADQDREDALGDQLYNFVPLIVKQEQGSIDEGDGLFSIWEVGPQHIAQESGEQELQWGSNPIPDDGNLYHPGALQWQADFDDEAGGVVSFNTEGEGMHYFNVDTTDYVPDDLGEVEANLLLGCGEPFFDDCAEEGLQVHSSAAPGRHYQMSFETGASGPAGDVTGDGLVDAADVDAVRDAVINASADGKFDLNSDGAVTDADRNFLITDLLNLWIGDANLDGEFNSSDFVGVFQAGKYEDRVDLNAGWAEGDWNGDGDFDSGDFVAAFQDGGFELGPNPAAANVPEPAGILLFLSGLGLAIHRRRRQALP